MIHLEVKTTQANRLQPQNRLVWSMNIRTWQWCTWLLPAGLSAGQTASI